MKTITANDLKTFGIQAIGDEETIVSYHGKPKYLIIPENLIDDFHDFRLEKALKEVAENFDAGRYSNDLDVHLLEIDSV